MRKLLRTLRPKTAAAHAGEPQRVGIPRITFNALTNGREATLHEKYTADLRPNSTIIVFPLSDHRADAPTLKVSVKRDLKRHIASLLSPGTKMLLVRTDAE